MTNDAGRRTDAAGKPVDTAIYGGAGDDALVGTSGSDVIFGFGGNDVIDGQAGADTMVGGPGNDTFVVDNSADTVSDGFDQGDDRILTSVSYRLSDSAWVETLGTTNEAGTSPLSLTGNIFAQSIYGNAGDNILTGMGGADYLVGGAGNDRYYVDSFDFIAEANGGGDDWIFVPTSYILREGAEIETLVAADQNSTAPVNLTGNEYGQSLYGSQGANSLNGGAGNDYLVGLGGNDTLSGDAGDDNMVGGAGNDTYYVDSVGDAIFEAVGEGDDIAVAFASFALGAGQSVEMVTVAEGSTAIDLSGNALAQSLYGNSGANILTAGGGADYLIGRAGADTFVLSNAAVTDPGAANIATIGDYESSDVVDVTEILSVAAGTDVIGGGYLRVTSAGQVQVDLDGGGDNWVTLSNINGNGAVAIRYLSGGTATDVSVARTSSTSMTMMAAAAAGFATMPAEKSTPDANDEEMTSGSSTAIATTNLAAGWNLAPPSNSESSVTADIGETNAGAATISTTHLAVKGGSTQTSGEALLSPEAAPLTPLSQGSEVPVAGNAVGHAIVAPAVAMPSAEMMQALGAPSLQGTAEAPAPEEVARVLLDALADDDGGSNLDAVLDAVAGQAAGPPALASLAAHAGPAGWTAGFAVAHEAFSMESMVAHHDAIPPA